MRLPTEIKETPTYCSVFGVSSSSHSKQNKATLVTSSHKTDVIDSLWSQKTESYTKGCKKIQCFKKVTKEFDSMQKKISQTKILGNPYLVPTVEKGNAYVKRISCSVAFREATHGVSGLEEPLVAVDGNSFKILFVTAVHSRPVYFVTE